ncbi:hypothetical protein AVEN_51791-1 [Araneus ventricosus]|uniref:Mutator-like transposase domain-containing protein n=1 Tax=Araneus ventricosus TaxID=182803 RepID=A0A4Y2M4G0_ARAVE|nr:hypothetical protein AVEN_51791-1 [Araneus ventricosus]
MDNVSRRYRKLKGWPSKRKRLCASNINRRWEKNKVENSAISMGTESCLSNEERDLGEQSADFLHLWCKAHKPECSENYVGSSNSMEVKAAEILWTRSVENCGMRYMNVLSVGDSKTYQDLLELDVYDDSMKISKEECLNHVAERLGTGLRNKVKERRKNSVCVSKACKQRTVGKMHLRKNPECK